MDEVYIITHHTGDYEDEFLVFGTKQKAIDYLYEVKALAQQYNAVVEDRLNWGVKAIWVQDEDGQEHGFILFPFSCKVQ